MLRLDSAGTVAVVDHDVLPDFVETIGVLQMVRSGSDVVVFGSQEFAPASDGQREEAIVWTLSPVDGLIKEARVDFGVGQRFQAATTYQDLPYVVTWHGYQDPRAPRPVPVGIYSNRDDAFWPLLEIPIDPEQDFYALSIADGLAILGGTIGPVLTTLEELSPHLIVHDGREWTNVDVLGLEGVPAGFHGPVQRICDKGEALMALLNGSMVDGKAFVLMSERGLSWTVEDPLAGSPGTFVDCADIDGSPVVLGLRFSDATPDWAVWTREERGWTERAITTGFPRGLVAVDDHLIVVTGVIAEARELVAVVDEYRSVFTSATATVGLTPALKPVVIDGRLSTIGFNAQGMPVVLVGELVFSDEPTP